MENKLLNAILAMDSYSRSYNEGIKLTGNTLGNITILSDSEVLDYKKDAEGDYLRDTDGKLVRNDQSIGFYAIAYQYEDVPNHTQTVRVAWPASNSGLNHP